VINYLFYQPAIAERKRKLLLKRRIEYKNSNEKYIIIIKKKALTLRGGYDSIYYKRLNIITKHYNYEHYKY